MRLEHVSLLQCEMAKQIAGHIQKLKPNEMLPES
jgi:hypothetical protein